MADRRALCADISAEGGEPLGATASRIDHWIIVEYRGVWAPHPLRDSALPDAVKVHVAEQLEALSRARLLFVRRPDRRHHPGLVCFVGRTSERGSTLRRLELESHDDLLDVDFAAEPGEPVDHPLFIVCTHGKRDRCCARYGRPLFAALCELSEADRVWQATHVGGDRFAGNLVCLPEGLYFGRVVAEDAWRVLDEYLAGRIHLDRYRGRCCYPFPVQAAERAVREHTGARGIDDLELDGIERAGEDRWTVAFRAGGEVLRADVSVEHGALAYLTCSAETLRRPRRYVARLDT
jgi:hypothetical protein